MNNAKVSKQERQSMIGKPCTCCGNPMDQPCWDHDPITGKFRGWLCHRCNLVLGKVEDDYDLLITLANYTVQR